MIVSYNIVACERQGSLGHMVCLCGIEFAAIIIIIIMDYVLYVLL